jgi:hypothetical protein
MVEESIRRIGNRLKNEFYLLEAGRRPIVPGAGHQQLPTLLLPI